MLYGKRSEETRNQRGQVLILLAVSMVGLIAILALVLDGGNLYLHRRRMQNAADAGALAGARILALDGTDGQASTAAYDYSVTRNDAATANIAVASPIVTVRACTPVLMSFARVLGINAQTVCATAVARFDGVNLAYGAAPIAIRDFEFVKGDPYTIWDDDKDMDPLTGNISGAYRGWLCMSCLVPESCGNCGSNLLKDWMVDGYEGAISRDEWVRGEEGVSAAVIQQAYVGQLIKIVVFDEIRQWYPGKDYYHVLKFAVFEVTEVLATRSPKGIQGIFVDYVDSGPPGPDDGGLRMVHLIE
jgi:hypothetical protein